MAINPVVYGVHTVFLKHLQYNHELIGLTSVLLEPIILSNFAVTILKQFIDDDKTTTIAHVGPALNGGDG